VRRQLPVPLLHSKRVLTLLLILLAVVLLWQRGVFAAPGVHGAQRAPHQQAQESSPTISATPDDKPSPTFSPTPEEEPSRTPTPTVTLTFTPSPTSTPTEWFDPALAYRIWCGGIYFGNTTGKPNRVSQYSSCKPLWDESGPEDVYIIPKTVPGNLEVSVESLDPMADMDLFLLSSPYASSCIASADAYAAWNNLAPGIYYLVVDGFQGTAGPYRLTINCAGEPTPTPTATFTPQFFRLPMAFKPRPNTPTPTPTLTPTPRPYSQGVNCGGAAYVAGDGITYLADRPYTPGSWGWEGGQASFVTTTDKDIVDTMDDPLYQSQRYAMNAYRFDVPRGRYKVFLRFSEIFPYISVGQRVFSVQLEGIPAITNLDLLAKGARNRAYDQELYVDVTDGRLDITFTQDPGYAFGAVINALSVERIGEPSAQMPLAQ